MRIKQEINVQNLTRYTTKGILRVGFDFQHRLVLIPVMYKHICTCVEMTKYLTHLFILQYIKYKTEHRNKTSIFKSLETHSKSRKLLLCWTGQNQC